MLSCFGYYSCAQLSSSRPLCCSANLVLQRSAIYGNRSLRRSGARRSSIHGLDALRRSALSLPRTQTLHHSASAELGCFGFYSCARLFRISGPMLSDARALRQSACRVLCCSASLLLCCSSSPKLGLSSPRPLRSSTALVLGLLASPILLDRPLNCFAGPALDLMAPPALWRSACLGLDRCGARLLCCARLQWLWAAAVLGWCGARPLCCTASSALSRSASQPLSNAAARPL